jgi:hypothetical protein
MSWGRATTPRITPAALRGQGLDGSDQLVRQQPAVSIHGER